MADIKNKNELKRRIDLFLDDFTHEEYMINEPFCKETMQMMREFIGRASHLLDCADAKIQKEKRKSRAKAIEDSIEASAKAICIGCGYLDRHSCTYNGSNCGVSKPMLEAVVKALEKLKGE